MSTASSLGARTVASRKTKRRIIWTAFATALAMPLPVAQAAINDWGQNCTGALQLNFCGSTEVSASTGPSGRTYLVLTTLSAAIVAAVWANHSDGSRTISAVVPAPTAGKDKCQVGSSGVLVNTGSAVWYGWGYGYNHEEGDDHCFPDPTTTTPEPATLALIGTGLIALAGGASRRRRTH